jgi:uracil-DNA glycosylase
MVPLERSIRNQTPQLTLALARIAKMSTATERRELLKAVYLEAKGCVACQLSETRTNVVFGSGNADAELMFVGEAPGANEDLQGLPFVGAAGKLLDKLLAEIGMQRNDVFIANTLKCRPPDNRNPYPHELDSCQHWLFSQLELIQPTMVCTLGNFATKLLRGDPTGISKIHGQSEIRTIGPRAVCLYPLYHPAAALYTPSTLEMLRADFLRIPEILKLGAPPQPEPPANVADSEPESVTLGEKPTVGVDMSPRVESNAPAEPETPAVSEQQLGLF